MREQTDLTIEDAEKRVFIEINEILELNARKKCSQNFGQSSSLIRWLKLVLG